MQRGYSILTIYKHALKPYIKLPSHMPKYQTHRKEEMFSKQGKRTVSQYWKYCATFLNAYFEQVSVKSKIVKQFMYNWLHYSKPRFSPNSTETNAKQRRETPLWFPFHWLWTGSWHMNLQTKIYSNNEQAQNWRWRNQNSKTVLSWPNHCTLWASSR